MRGKVPAAGALALGDLVLMVREHQIDPAGVEIEVGTEVFPDHGRALEVPARTPLAPRRRPEVHAVLRLARLPQHEIGQAVLLVFVGIGPGVLSLPEIELALVEMGKLPVAGERRDLEVDRAVVRRVGVAFPDQGLDHRDLLRDVLDRARLDVRRQQPERIAVGVELLRPEGREILQRLPRRLRVADRLVVDVGDVADMESPHPAGLQRAAEDVLEHEGPEVPDVRGTVNGGSAAVEPVGRAIQGAELLELAGQRVVKPHRGGV